MDGTAESYVGVSVLFIEDGRDPVMSIKEASTGKERERIQLKDYNTEEALIGLMNKYGFQKRTKKEFQKYKSKQRALQDEWDEENDRRAMEEARKMKQKKDEIAARVLKMMEENMKKAQLEAEKIA